MLPGNEKLKKFFKNKKILITGNTGFKGSWLSFLLINLESKIYGFSKDIPTKPSLFKLLRIKNRIKHINGNVKNLEKFKNTIYKFKPNIIFHLAAQSLVFKSHNIPLETILTNSIGTLNLLEILKDYKKKLSCVIITSDKCYEPKNKNIFSEDDSLGGIDPYSASKASAEIYFKSYFETQLKKKKNIKVCTVRAGNVIGGGDWSKNRLVPDVLNSINKKKKIIIRKPLANRPWQHVFEPILSYILLSIELHKGRLNGESFNVGPNFKNNINVLNLIKKLLFVSKSTSRINIIQNKKYIETNQLNLNTNKILKLTKWKKVLTIDQTIKLIIDWNNVYIKNIHNIENESLRQLHFFLNEYYKLK